MAVEPEIQTRESYFFLNVILANIPEKEGRLININNRYQNYLLNNKTGGIHDCCTKRKPEKPYVTRSFIACLARADHYPADRRGRVRSLAGERLSTMLLRRDQ